MSINDQPICFISGLIELDKNHQAKVSPASYRLLLRFMSLSRPGCKLAKLQQITIENRKPVIKLNKEIECHGHFEVVPLQYSAVALQPGGLTWC